MANITPRHDKAGNVISYRIRVSRGYDLEGNKLKPYEMTFKPAPGMTRRQAEKEVQRQALLFEEQCRQGYAPDNRQTFAQYAAYAMQCKEQAGRKRRTLERYQDLLQRINAGIGHIKLAELRPQHLTAFYNQLRQAGVRTSSGVAAPIADFRAVMAQKQLTRERLAACSGVSPTTITSLCKGNRIQAQCAEKLADALEMDKAALFSFQVSTKPLAEKTVLEYHRLIASVLAQAEKEMLVPYNAAEKVVNKPKSALSHPVNYFQPEELERIRDALEQEPLKWQVITHLLLVTGCRRGEIMGLKWSAVDLQAGTLRIENNLLYSRKLGVYEDTTKTETSARVIRIPEETAQLLRRYREEWETLRQTYGASWNSYLQIPTGSGELHSQRAEFLFIREEAGKVGYPMNPDSPTGWLAAFSKRHNLPHINPHAFRHTLASVLCMQNIDITTIRKWLGHKSVTTTLNIYEHILEQGKEQVVNCVSDVILKKHTPAKGQA